MRRNQRRSGFSLPELLVVVGMLAVVSAISIPLFATAFARSRANGASEALQGAIRDARMRAIATGWQYRVVAFDGAGAVPNTFRIEGMNPATGGVFPAPGAATDPPFYGANQTYESYTDLAADFGSAQILIPGGGPFTVTFDSRGQWAVPCVPVGCQVQVKAQSGAATLTISQAGAVLKSN